MIFVPRTDYIYYFREVLKLVPGEVLKLMPTEV